MELAQEKKVKAQNSAKKRWETKDIEQTQCDSNANAKQTQCDSNASKGNKVKEIKENKKDIYAPSVTLTKEEYQKLLDKFGDEDTAKRITNLSLWQLSNAQIKKSSYYTILNWANREEKKETTKTNSKFPPEIRQKQLEYYQAKGLILTDQNKADCITVFWDERIERYKYRLDEPMTPIDYATAKERNLIMIGGPADESS
jgi:hypothetical protein